MAPALRGGCDPASPSIHFGTDTGSLLELQRDAGGDVIGLDWRVELDAGLGPARAGRGRPGEPRPGRPVRPRRRDRAGRSPRSSTRPAGRPGHIFNLGHGILPHTPVDNVLALIDAVHEGLVGSVRRRTALSGIPRLPRRVGRGQRLEDLRRGVRLGDEAVGPDLGLFARFSSARRAVTMTTGVRQVSGWLLMRRQIS